eukprot:gene4813-5277_t
MSLKHKTRGLQIEDLDGLHYEEGQMMENRSGQLRHSVSNPPPFLQDYLPPARGRPGAVQALGRKKKKGKQAPSSSIMGLSKQLLPPMDHTSREQAERKMEELERIAAGSAALQHALLLSRGTASANASGAGGMVGADFPSKPSTSTMTGTEADFLVRQIHSSDLSQLSLLSNPSEFESAAVGMGLPSVGASMESSLSYSHSMRGGDKGGVSSGGGRGGGEAVATLTEALREKILSLEQQLARANQIVAKREMELEKKDEKIKGLQNDLQESRATSSKEVQQLRDRHRVELASLREQHNKEKASLLTASRNAEPSNTASPATPNRGGVDGGAVGGQFESNHRLLEQIGSLQQELRQAQQTAAEERRALHTDHANKLSSLSQRYEAQLIEARLAVAKVEDALSQSREEVQSVRAEVVRLQRLNQQTEALRLKAMDDQAKLRADLKNMQQSVQAAYRLDTASASFGGTASGAGGGGTMKEDSATNIKLIEARSEAKVKQMANKVDFLKSQLDTEKKAVEDLRQAHQNLQQELLAAREVAEQKLRQLQAEHAQALNETEDRVKMVYEGRMRELTTLQHQVRTLSSSLQEKENDRVLWQQREDELQSQYSRLQSQNLALQKEVAAVRQQQAEASQALNATTSASTALTGGGSSTSNPQDALLLRRLDNERHYLKNQLTTEIALKNNLQTALDEVTTQLSAVQKQWSDDVQTLQDRHREAEEKWQATEASYQQQHSALEAEIDHLQSLQKELKTALQTIREDYRLTQSRQSQLTSEKDHLLEDLHRWQSDYQRLEKEQETLRRQHEDNMKVLRDVVLEQERRQLEERQRWKDELAKHFVEQGQLQQEQVHLQTRMKEEQVAAARLLPVLRMGQAVDRWRRARLSHAFHLWSMHRTLLLLTTQFKQQMEKNLHLVEQQAKKKYQQKLVKQQEEVTAHHNNTTQSLREELQQSLEKQLAEQASKNEAEREELVRQHRQQMEQQEEDFRYDLDLAQREVESQRLVATTEGEQALQRLQAQHEESIALLKQHNLKEVEEALHRCEVEQRQVQEEERQRYLEAHRQEVLRLEAAAQQRLDEALAERDKDWTERVRRQVEQQEEEHRLATAFATQAHEETLLLLRKQQQEEVECLRALLEAEKVEALRQQRAQAVEEEEERVRSLRVVWQEEEAQAVAVAVEATRQEEAQRLAKAQQEAQEEAQRLVKAEGRRWQQRLVDLQHGLDLQIARSRQEAEERLAQDYLVREEAVKAVHAAEKERWVQEEEERVVHLREEMVAQQEEVVAAARLQWQEEAEVRERQLRDSLLTDYREEVGTLRAKQAQEEEEHRLALAKSQQRLAALQEEVSLVHRRYAEERSKLLEQVEEAEEAKASLSAALQAEREDQQDLLLRHQDQLASLAQKMKQEQEGAVARARREEQEKADHLLHHHTAAQEEEQRLALDTLATLHKKQIAQLEEEVASLSQSKQKAEEEVQRLSQRVEEAEDSLYDATQQLKASQKHSSFSLWQRATRDILAQQRWKALLAQQRQEQEEEKRRVRAEGRYQTSSCSYLLYRYLFSLQMVYQKHALIRQVLVGYKMEEVQAVKRAVRQLEEEVEEVVLARDAAEEEREGILKDIAILTEEIHNNEDELRALNASAGGGGGRGSSSGAGGGGGGGSLLGGHGSININLARKNKRINEEIERLYEQIEGRKGRLEEVDAVVKGKLREKEEKEGVLVDHERRLVAIILEQQKYVLQQLQEAEVYRGSVLKDLADYQLPTPSSSSTTNGVLVLAKEPTTEEVQEMMRKKWEEEDKERERRGL